MMAEPPPKVDMKPTARYDAAKKRKFFDDGDDTPGVKKPKSQVGGKVAKARAPKNTATPKPEVASKKAVPKKATAAAIPAAPKKTAAPKTAAVPKKLPSAKAVLKKPATACKAAPTAKPAAATKVSTEATIGAQKSKPVKVPAKSKAAIKPAKAILAINEIPSKILDIYVFGEGSSGELGLGNEEVDGIEPIDVKWPVLNEHLSAKDVGVVQIAVGGMHCAALTKDNQILTWGVNDQGALGRDTEGDDDAEDDEVEHEWDFNPMECKPAAVSDAHFAPGTKFVQLAASDSATFVVTADGSVYGWGTFRSNDGILGFTQKIYIQTVPMKIPELKKITSIATGANHVLALDQKGNVWAWGCGQQNQLGRRIVERTRLGGLVPREFGLPRNKIASIASGAYHSFAIDNKGQVWAWGLNNFGETGISEGCGDDNAVISTPTIVTELKDYTIKEIRGGGHHSLACTNTGKLLVWGRMDASQVGIRANSLDPDEIVFDERGIARILLLPTIIPDLNVVSVAAGTDNSFAITDDGKAYAWGFSANYQTGLDTENDVQVPTLINHSTVKGKKFTFAGAGGQFSVLAGFAEDGM